MLAEGVRREGVANEVRLGDDNHGSISHALQLQCASTAHELSWSYVEMESLLTCIQSNKEQQSSATTVNTAFMHAISNQQTLHCFFIDLVVQSMLLHVAHMQ